MTAIKYRPSVHTDEAYVYRSWIRSFRESPFGRTLTDDAYNLAQQGKMEAILDVANVTIVCPDDDPDTIIAFAVHDRTEDDLLLVHYLYVRELSRHQGVAQKLIQQLEPTEPIVFTDITLDFYKLREKHDLPYVTTREYQNLHRAKDFNQAFQTWFHNQQYKNIEKRKKFHHDR